MGLLSQYGQQEQGKKKEIVFESEKRRNYYKVTHGMFVFSNLCSSTIHCPACSRVCPASWCAPAGISAPTLRRPDTNFLHGSIFLFNQTMLRIHSPLVYFFWSPHSDKGR